MLTIQCKMSKGTIESAHVEKLNFLKGNEEIEYLLDVAHVLETYGEQDGAQHHEDVHCTKSIVFKKTDGKKICAYEYCNAHDHLKKKFCHGNECNTTAQAANCENHFFDHGISEPLGEI